MMSSPKKILLRRIVVIHLWLVALYTMAALEGIIPSTITVREAEYISLGYLILGLMFLFFNEIRLLLVCFACGAVISFLIHERFPMDTEKSSQLPIGQVILPPFSFPKIS
jgi:membrane protein implicated in regulation of membrane protease activity